MDRKESSHKLSQPFSSHFPTSPISSLKFPSVSTPTLLPSMSPVTSALEDLGLKEISANTVSKLLEQLLETNGGKSTIMLLDMRPPECHTASSIRTSVGVSVPSMLLKRPMYSLDMVAEQLTTKREVETFTDWRRFPNIVLFDATGATPVKGTPMYYIAQKFRREGCDATLAYIHGGYNAFALDHASLCCSDGGVSCNRTVATNNSDMANADSNKAIPSTARSTTRGRLHLGPLPNMELKIPEGATICRTPMIGNPDINPLFENVRLAMGLNTNITEEVPVRLPLRFPIDSIRDRLPTWLLNSICEETGKTRVAEYFQKIEVAEKKRLAQLMAPQEIQSCRTAEFSICAGLEKGLKNRYNHVWPFDHTRVRIKECEEGEDDYINASLLKPPFGQKSYIVTQGPLPSTFQDFWKVIWEQESRVIVMLTREFEMGRIKCHRYWPTSDHPVMSLGSLKVTYMNDYRPEYSDDTILVHQVKLSHLNHPDMPERTITHIHYTGWPDFGVPESPMEVLKVVQLANAHNTLTSAGPMTVHCSAGCGRTGAFCVIDSILSELQSNPEAILAGRSQTKASPGSFQSNFTNERGPDMTKRDPSQLQKSEPMEDVIFVTVNRFREQRLSMVQCLRQYVFCYEAILWHLAIELMKGQ
ncbi:hypothetical protein BGZ80_003464 [Entomortierella chlamydospora]|uniref:protein-tyrosine-phosphatase n=1 Tax=Entomortierella chlamydospora TaxID=101097 RepID=A0A9P6MPG2_9FUNG|nr:hypothetical protein BGZ80_003464 [Entomortierella chlamydospora]